MKKAPSGVKQDILAIRDLDTELHDHANTVHGVKDCVSAQNSDVQSLALNKLVQHENIDKDLFPEDVRALARNYFKQKRPSAHQQKRSFVCEIPPSQPLLHERHCMIVMPQLYHQEILFHAHDAMGHQSITKVMCTSPLRGLAFSAT